MEDQQLATPTSSNVDGGDGSVHSTPDLESSDTGESTVFHESSAHYDDVDSTCSTPYVSAPSSPSRGGLGGGGFFYSAPASPMHFLLCSSRTSPNFAPPVSEASMSASFEFDFSARFGIGTTGSALAGSMSSADELFLNGQIRPMKLSTHLQRPQLLAPLPDLDEVEADSEATLDKAERNEPRGREVKWRDRSLRRRTRSMSPLRTSSFQWHEGAEERAQTESKRNKEELASTETTPSSSRSSSVSRSSRKWELLKDFLYRSKSEGRNNGHKFWSSISFSPVSKERKTATESTATETKKVKQSQPSVKEPTSSKTKKVKRRRAVPPPSPHELHYTANRAQAEEMRKKTFLPYRQGLLGCLGFSSKSYGAMNGLARALNPVSSG
ncbi:uncharacterized protein LOC127799755 [Diospyros lotus]|uniref:uncharacterized protein LOC127799755 n=1 Tax=Diospyros lotus TaxID=55363 RepID=UPI0022582747|nr:uncharacterized protein LOC127799755 [Diospyros lotus]